MERFRKPVLYPLSYVLYVASGLTIVTVWFAVESLALVAWIPFMAWEIAKVRTLEDRASDGANQLQ
jgi:hypothetical protein